jgi:5-formyltetrahydrofolate cyclo-ligase
MNVKEPLRAAARERRAALKRARQSFAHEISRFAADIALLGSGAIAGYIAMRDEADPAFLLEALARLGRDIALPCVVGRDEALVFRAWSEGEELRKGPFGIREPAATVRTLVPEIVLVPLLSFDSGGHRLGYGGGYYDRTLAQLRERSSIGAVGIAYAGQEVDRLPRDQHDHVLDWVLTERGLRKLDPA